MIEPEDVAGALPEPPATPPEASPLKKIAVTLAVTVFIGIQIYLLLPERSPEPVTPAGTGTSGAAAVATPVPTPTPVVEAPMPAPRGVAPAGPGEHLATPPPTWIRTDETETPDPARILRLYVNDTTMRPRHFKVEAAHAVFFMVDNLSRKPCTLSISGAAGRQVVSIKPGQERFVPVTLTLTAGVYRVASLENGQERVSGDLLVQ